LLCDELNEDIHYWQIRSWIGLGDTDNALKQYETAVKVLLHRSSGPDIQDGRQRRDRSHHG
jgi:hypothetical protein